MIPRRPSGDTGSGSILAMAIAVVTLALTGLIVPIYAATALRQSSALAADAAALAAADAVAGAVTGYPCERAEQAAQLNGARLGACTLDGLIVTVTVQRLYLGFQMTARSRAGPPTTSSGGANQSTRTWR